MKEYEIVIGMEVHAQLSTGSKLFCSCPVEFGAPPNSLTCPVCLGLPGVLPVINKRAVNMVIKTALALNCEVERFCRFSRKNYYYPDMPKNYQISQYDLPISRNGWIEVETDRALRRIRIRRVHLEEDVGKLFHPDPFSSLVDYNRAGIPLMEIVSEPDIRGVEEAVQYLMELRSILQYLGVCSGSMEEGVFRCESNISVRPKGAKEFGTRIELKNLNSFKAVEKGLKYEVRRQLELLENNEEVIQETRRFDDETETTKPMRSKEEAEDYRYFPEPDLVPIFIDEGWLSKIKDELVELPMQRRRRFIKEYKLSEYDAKVLTSSKALADFFEATIKAYPDYKTVANWCMVELLRLLNLQKIELSQAKIKPWQLADMLKLMHDGVISGKLAKSIFEEMFYTGKPAMEIIKEKGLEQIIDEQTISKVIDEVLAANEPAVKDFKAGRRQSFGFLVGQVMKATCGKANPQVVNKLLKERLS